MYLSDIPSALESLCHVRNVKIFLAPVSAAEGTDSLLLGVPRAGSIVTSDKVTFLVSGDFN